MSDRFSHSKIETYGACPRQYKFRYIQRAKVEKEVTVELFLGQTLHKCLQRLYEARSVSKVLSLEELMEIYHAEWEKAPVETLKVSNDQLSVSDYIENGRESLEKFYATYAPFSQEETLSVEARVQFTLDQERAYTMTGIIDRIARRPDCDGGGISRMRSKRPGRTSAGSRQSSRLVAAGNATPRSGRSPSRRPRSCVRGATSKP